MILGIETTTVACSVALYSGKPLVERTLYQSRAHSVKLMTLVNEAIRDAAPPGGITAVAVSAGPGSFTGLRIGIATAKGLAFGWGVPVVPVPTMDALAHAAGPWPGPVCTLLSARRGEVYAAVYDGAKGTRTGGPCYSTPESLPSIIENSNDSILFVGDAPGMYLDELQAAFGDRVVIPPEAMRLPRAWSVCALAEGLLAAGQGVSPMEARPCYLRASEAELNWLRKERA